MGNENSSLSNEQMEEETMIGTNPMLSPSNPYGFRVLGVQANSPCSQAGFIMFMDFIIAANGIRLDQRDSTFMEIIHQFEEKLLILDVYNIKNNSTREITIKPSKLWNGKGLLGITIRFDTFENSEENILHVLEIKKNSPADIAGLEPWDDYLLGTNEKVFEDDNDLYNEIMNHINQKLQCYVYNCKTDQIRIVTIEPNNTWGGEGYLGAEVGYGYLHQLPKECRKTLGKSLGYICITSPIHNMVEKNKNNDDTADANDRRNVKENENLKIEMVQANPKNEVTQDEEEGKGGNEEQNNEKRTDHEEVEEAIQNQHKELKQEEEENDLKSEVTKSTTQQHHHQHQQQEQQKQQKQQEQPPPPPPRSCNGIPTIEPNNPFGGLPISTVEVVGSAGVGATGSYEENKAIL